MLTLGLFIGIILGGFCGLVLGMEVMNYFYNEDDK